MYFTYKPKFDGDEIHAHIIIWCLLFNIVLEISTKGQGNAVWAPSESSGFVWYSLKIESTVDDSPYIFLQPFY